MHARMHTAHTRGDTPPHPPTDASPMCDHPRTRVATPHTQRRLIHTHTVATTHLQHGVVHTRCVFDNVHGECGVRTPTAHRRALPAGAVLTRVTRAVSVSACRRVAVWPCGRAAGARYHCSPRLVVRCSTAPHAASAVPHMRIPLGMCGRTTSTQPAHQPHKPGS